MLRRATLLLLSLLATAGWSQNLLPDSGLEEGKWDVTSWDFGKGKHEYVTPGRDGGRCVHLVGIEAKPASINELAASPVVSVKGGSEYVFSVWYRTTPGTMPFLSFLTYTAPFATAAWKTPSAQYENRNLDAAEAWRLATWRFRTDPRAVEMRILVRLNAVGEVWYDDASLLCVDGYGLETLRPGHIFRLPDGRIYEARVAAPREAKWSLVLHDADGALVGQLAGQGPRDVARIEFTAAEGKPVTVELRQGDNVLLTEEFHTPPLTELALDTCRYRRAVFASSKPEALEATLRLNMTDDLTRQATLRAALLKADAAGVSGDWRPARAANVPLRFPADSLTPGAWKVAAEVRLASEVRKLEQPLRVMPPGKPHEVIIDDANRLRVDGKPFFPAGFYGAPDNDDRARPIAQAGYNTILTYMSDPEACRKWLDMCSRLGLWGMVSVPHPFVEKYDEGKLREALRVVKDHPALLAWYLFDEPSPSAPGQRPEDLKRVHDTIADEDPYHPIGLCLCVADLEPLYVDAYDALMIDVYPVTTNPSPLTQVSDRFDHAGQSTRRLKPVWNIPQTFGYDVVEGREKQSGWVTPTPAQERVMHYLALTHGARGSVAYCYHVYTRFDAEAQKAGKWPWFLGGYLPDKQTVLWGELVRLAKEQALLSEALLQPRQETRVYAEGQLHVGWFLDRGKAWVVAVNADATQAHRQVVDLPKGVAPPKAVTDLGIGGSASLEDGRVVLEVPAMGTVAARLRF